MKRDLVLEIQSYVDGELSGVDRTRIEAILVEDAAARELRDGLLAAKALLAEAEMEREVPAALPFYWNQIAERIRIEKEQEPGWLDRWRRWWALATFRWAVASLTVGVLLGAGALVWRAEEQWASFRGPQEIESTAGAGHVADISFVSESAGISVVWIANRFEY